MRVLGSITNRIFLASALLAMLSIAAAVYFVSERLTQQTEAELQSDLTEAATLVADQRQSEVDAVTRTARLIADLFRTAGANRIHLEFDDLSAEVERLRGEGMTFLSDVVTAPGGSQILLADPDGNLVELFQPA